MYILNYEQCYQVVISGECGNDISCQHLTGIMKLSYYTDIIQWYFKNIAKTSQKYQKNCKKVTKMLDSGDITKTCIAQKLLKVLGQFIYRLPNLFSSFLCYPYDIGRNPTF